MAHVYEEIDEKLREFILSQHVFFVATAPLAGDGLVNLSPKGLDGLRVLGPRSVAYLDLTGSGIETLAHVKENGRICLMFCSFDAAPKIVRLHGRGEALEPGDPDFEALLPLFPKLEGTRAIIRVAVSRVADSCGWGVPIYHYEGQRDQLVNFTRALGPEKLLQAQRMKNSKSLDGLPGLRFPEESLAAGRIQ